MVFRKAVRKRWNDHCLLCLNHSNFGVQTRLLLFDETSRWSPTNLNQACQRDIIWSFKAIPIWCCFAHCTRIRNREINSPNAQWQTSKIQDVWRTKHPNLLAFFSMFSMVQRTFFHLLHRFWPLKKLVMHLRWGMGLCLHIMLMGQLPRRHSFQKKAAYTGGLNKKH